MITAIDSNVLFDIFLADSQFGHLSSKSMRQALQQGTAVACSVVLAEVSSLFKDQSKAMRALADLGVRFDSLDEDAALGAGRAWRRYRERGGPRTRVVADFLIGAHAKTRADRLLTRDAGFYRDYFRGLVLLDPTE